MISLALPALLSLAALVSADQSFTLVGKADNFEHNVLVSSDNVIGFENGGEFATFTLEEPSGYLSALGKNVINGPDGFYLGTEDHSKDFGVDSNGNLRFGPAGNSLYACPNDDKSYTLKNYACTDGVVVSLALGAAGSTPSSSSEAPTSAAPEVTSSAWNNATSTETDVHSTLVTVTSCSGGCTASSQPAVSSYEAGAGQAKLAAGAVVVAGALLL